MTKLWQVFFCPRNVSTAKQATFVFQENGADTPSHISVSLNFQQIESERASVVLNEDSVRHVRTQVSTEGHMASSWRSQIDGLCALDKDTAGICKRSEGKRFCFLKLHFSLFLFSGLFILCCDCFYRSFSNATLRTETPALCKNQKGSFKRSRNRCNGWPLHLFYCFLQLCKTNYVSHQILTMQSLAIFRYFKVLSKTRRLKIEREIDFKQITTDCIFKYWIIKRYTLDCQVFFLK